MQSGIGQAVARRGDSRPPPSPCAQRTARNQLCATVPPWACPWNNSFRQRSAVGVADCSIALMLAARTDARTASNARLHGHPSHAAGREGG